MARLKFALLFLLLLTLSPGIAITQAQTETPAPSGLLVYNVWVRPTASALADGATPEAPVPGTVAGAYLTITNTSTEDFQLVGVDAAISSMPMIHQSSIDDKGIARMRMIMSLDIPAGQTVTFEPGGYHVMLPDVTHDVYPGDTVPLTLSFTDSSGASFDLPVAALALDMPPEPDTLIVANAVAQPDADNAATWDVSLIIDNQGDADALTSVTTPISEPPIMMRLDAGRMFPYTTLDIPAAAQTPFTQDGVFIRLGKLIEAPGTSFPLTLTFASGKVVTVAVPVLGAAS